MDWRTTPKRLSCVLLLAAAALPLAAITPAPTAKTCDAVLQWARDNRESLPRDYQGLLAYPLHERRAIFIQLTAAEKSSFWSEKIALFLERHPELEAGQLRAVAEVRALLQPAFYAAPEPGAPGSAFSEAELLRFAERMKGILGGEAARELLFGLGPEAPGLDPAAAALSYCECRRGADECPAWLECRLPPPLCTQRTGCGVGANQACNGNCAIIP